MRIIDLHYGILRQAAHITMQLFMTSQQVLHTGRGQKVELLQPQLPPLLMRIFRVQHLGDDLGQLLFLQGMTVITAIERVQIQPVYCTRTPQAQGGGTLRLVTHNGHIIRHGINRLMIVILYLHALFFPQLLYPTAKAYLVTLVAALYLPHAAAFYPVIGQLHLPPFQNTLTKQAVLIANTAADHRQIGGGQAVQKAGGQAPQATVAQRGIVFALLYIGQIITQLLQSLLVVVIPPHVDQIVDQSAPDQILRRQIIQLLLLFFTSGICRGTPQINYLFTQTQCHGVINLLFASFFHTAAKVQPQLAHYILL